MEFNKLQEALQGYIAEVAEMYKNNLIKDGKKASGDLIRSIKPKIQINDFEYTLELELEDYWKYVENGSKPHFPPVDALIKWIEKKPIRPKDGLVKNNEQLAYLIGRKISREGIKPGNQLSKSIEEANQKWMPIIDEAVTEDLVIELDNIFIDF